MKSTLNNMILTVTVLIIGAVVLNSCDVNHALDPKKYAKVYMPQARKNPAKRSVFIVDSTQTIVYGAAYGGPSKPASDIPVEFSVKPALVDSFNQKHLTSYSILPSNSYTLSKKMAAIPAGKLSTPALALKLKTNGYIQAGGIQYLLPIQMKIDGGPTPINENLETTYFLIQGTYVELDKSGWQVIDSDSGHPGYLASNIIDGDDGSLWNTEYQPIAPLPHYATIDMGQSQLIHGFRLIGRGGPYAFESDQNPKEITMQFSDDGTNWKNGESFTLPFNASVHMASIYLSNSVNARYFKFIITANVNGPVTNFNEIYAF